MLQPPYLPWKMPQGSSLDGTALGMMNNWDSIHDMSRNFSLQQHPGQLCSPPILLFSVYLRFFSQDRSAGV